MVKKNREEINIFNKKNVKRVELKHGGDEKFTRKCFVCVFMVKSIKISIK